MASSGVTWCQQNITKWNWRLLGGGWGHETELRWGSLKETWNNHKQSVAIACKWLTTPHWHGASFQSKAIEAKAKNTWTTEAQSQVVYVSPAMRSLSRLPRLFHAWRAVLLSFRTSKSQLRFALRWWLSLVRQAATVAWSWSFHSRWCSLTGDKQNYWEAPKWYAIILIYLSILFKCICIAWFLTSFEGQTLEERHLQSLARGASDAKAEALVQGLNLTDTASERVCSGLCRFMM